MTALRKAYPDARYVFTTERGTRFTPDAVNRLVKTIGRRAGLSLPVHFHMLRHSCGYKLANDGIDTRAIQDWPDAIRRFLARLSTQSRHLHERA